jgi:hypothetical protein
VITVTEEEKALMEMASFYKVKDKAGFKSALAKYKEAKGDKFDKGALGKLLSTLDKDGEVDLKALSKETGKDIATYNNPQTRGALEKEGGEFTDYLEAGKGEKAPKEKAEDKPKAEPKKAEKKVEPKKEKPAPKKEEPKKAEKEEDEDDSTDDKAPSEAELKKNASIATIVDTIAKLTKDRKETNEKYKKAEGEEKAKLLDKLKDLTSKIQPLEKALKEKQKTLKENNLKIKIMKKSQLQQIIKEEIKKILKEEKQDIKITDGTITFNGEDYTVQEIIGDIDGIRNKIIHQKVTYRNEDWYVDGIEDPTPSGYGYKQKEYDKEPKIHLTKQDPENINIKSENNPEIEHNNKEIEAQLNKLGLKYKKIPKKNSFNITNFYEYKINLNGKDYYITYSLDRNPGGSVSVKDSEGDTINNFVSLNQIKKYLI